MSELLRFDRLKLRIVTRDMGSVARQLREIPPEVLDQCGIPRLAADMLALWAHQALALHAATTDAPGDEPVRGET